MKRGLKENNVTLEGLISEFLRSHSKGVISKKRSNEYNVTLGGLISVF